VTVLQERGIRIEFPDAVSWRKFDAPATHGLTHCMKAVDVIVELEDRILFIEVKDPTQAAEMAEKERGRFFNELRSGHLDQDLAYMYRDSFLYEWAADRHTKAIYHLVLVAFDRLTPADLLARTDALKRSLPRSTPKVSGWKRPIVDGCLVLNLAAWNDELQDYPAHRVAE
jgi:hypothetical protein